jgi:hypothetical protein
MSCVHVTAHFDVTMVTGLPKLRILSKSIGRIVLSPVAPFRYSY